MHKIVPIIISAIVILGIGVIVVTRLAELPERPEEVSFGVIPEYGDTKDVYGSPAFNQGPSPDPTSEPTTAPSFFKPVFLPTTPSSSDDGEIISTAPILPILPLFPSPTSSSLDEPVIFSVTPTIITNATEEITITGAHFSSNGNTVLTSSEPADAFVNISSTDGETISFMFHFSPADDLRDRITKAAAHPALSYSAIAEAVLANMKLSLTGPLTTQVPVRFLVRTENGDSNAITVLIDMSSLLQE